jgi:hypothetical protein
VERTGDNNKKQETRKANQKSSKQNKETLMAGGNVSFRPVFPPAPCSPDAAQHRSSSAVREVEQSWARQAIRNNTPESEKDQ